MNILKTSLAILFLLNIFSCNTKSKNNLIDEHSAKNSLDWLGSYWGIIPCDDCPGIELELSLNSDNSFTLFSEYLENEDSESLISGEFNWVNGGNSVELVGFPDKESSQIFKIEENQVKYLDKNGKEIKGELANNYILKKNGNPLVDNKKWKIVEIYGQKIESNSDEEFFMNFNAEDSRVYAKLDCNLLNWEYKIRNELMINFSNGITTLMACPNDFENQFVEAINMADNISSDGKILSINKARMAPLVVLELIEE